MKLKLDENLPIEAAEILVASGYDAHTVLQEGLGGASDSSISTICLRENRVLITLDTDFCNILTYPPKQYSGLIVIRTLDQSKPKILEYIETIRNILSKENPAGHLWIVQKDGIRVR